MKMGYRNYIAPITKTEYERIKNFTKEELYKEHNEDFQPEIICPKCKSKR